MHAFLLPFVATQACCGPGCRADAGATAAGHYDEAYFAWQATLGLKKARERPWWKFIGAGPNDTVADLGAGTGAILSTMSRRVARTIAIEYSDHARKYMAAHSPEIGLYKYPEDLDDATVDVLLSTSVIEHLECPVAELRALRPKLVPGGRVVIGVKNEGVELWREWRDTNRDNHLYTWNSVLLANTVRAAGFVVDSIEWSGHNETDIIANKFGRAGHTFQYLYVRGHRPRVGEPWPQRDAVVKLMRAAGGGRAKSANILKAGAGLPDASHYQAKPKAPGPGTGPSKGKAQAPLGAAAKGKLKALKAVID